MDLTDWINHHADTSPDKLAIIFEGGEISYAALARQVDSFAGILNTRLGLKPGDRVAYLGQNSPVMIALLFACARTGAILVPLNWRLAAAEHAQLVQLAKPHALFVGKTFIEHIDAIRGQFDALSLVALGEAGEGWTTLGELETSGRGLGEISQSVDLSEDDGLLLCYTSGTTGIPKGALLSRKALTWNAANSIHMHDLTSEDMVLTVLPMFHVGGLNIQTLPALCAGATVVIHRHFETEFFYQSVEEYPITLTLVVPTVMHALMADERWLNGKPDSLRMISIGSTVVPESMVLAVCNWGVPLVQVYGSTETCPIAAYTPPQDAARKPASTGRTAKHCEIRIADNQGDEAPVGVSGEILVRGPNLMTGYWRDAEATRNVFSGDWFHSGDFGHFDVEGFLYVDGRLKDMIISGGENIYPAQIENVLAELEDIEEVAVVGRPDTYWGEVAVAVVVVKPGHEVDAERIVDFCSGRISRFSCPREVITVERLPRNAMGKVLKKDVRKLVAEKFEISKDQ